jgi:hypothetical protein
MQSGFPHHRYRRLYGSLEAILVVARVAPECGGIELEQQVTVGA